MNMQLGQIAKYQSIKKWLLHTRWGAYFGFIMGDSRYKKISPIVNRFQRVYREGEKLRRKEIISMIGDTGVYGVYKSYKIRPSYNSRVNVGAGLCAFLLSGSNLASLTSPAVFKYIALSTSSLTPAAGDTTLTGETSATGLGRVLGTIGTYTGPASLDGAASYVISNTFTNTSGGTVTIVSSALFDAVSTGNMCCEANLSSSVALANNDQVIIQWTNNF
jgi:hypothetical protein